MKKLFTLALSLLLVGSLAVTAFASETEGQQPLTEDQGETTHTHSWGSGSVTTAATCTTDGLKTYTCSCGETSTEVIKATGHAYGEWFQGKSVHERTCSACGDVQGGEHSMSSSVTTAPTCQSAGVETHTCGVCGYSYTTEVPVSSTHSYGDWTSGAEGHSRSCTACGKTDSGAHTWADATVTTAATCKDEGVATQACTVCGGTKTMPIPKLTTHTYDNVCDGECNVCGATRETAHNISTAWSRDWKEHWHECTLCGYKSEPGDHYPGPAATEEKDQLCLTCGMVMTPRKNHTHSYSTTWSSNEAGHWYSCDGCEDQKDYAFHEYDDLCDPDCNICGYEPPTAHSYDETWSMDETGHWTVCVLCGDVKDTEAHTADPNAAPTDAQICTVCGYEMAPAKEHVHEAAAQWVSDEENHWKSCECGEEMEKAPHAWDEGTENEDTTITYVCAGCGAEKTEGEPKEPASFPYGLVLAGLLALAAGLGVALFFVLRSGKKK